MSIEEIKERLMRNGIPFPEELPGKLYTYFILLKEWNSRMDLTAVTDDGEMIDKHYRAEGRYPPGNREPDRCRYRSGFSGNGTCDGLPETPGDTA